MSEVTLSIVLLVVGGLFAVAVAVGLVLRQVRIPPILAALLVAMVARYTPIGPLATDPGPVSEILVMLGHLGASALLFYIGLQLDVRELARQGRDVLILGASVCVLPFLFGVGVMLGLGYALPMALLIGMTRVPTAEAVVVPILDELGFTKTSLGSLIIGVGTLDDVIEILLIVLVSGWLATGEGGSWTDELAGVAVGLGGILAMAAASSRWVLPWILGKMADERNLQVALSLAVLFLFAGASEYSGSGFIIGALAAGAAMGHAAPSKAMLDSITADVRLLTYGFLGPAFFFSVGLSADVAGIVQVPLLTLGLYLAAMLGKVVGALAMVPLGRLSFHRALVTGIALDARLTTEIVVAQLLLDSGHITLDLFTALVAASSLSTVSIPVVLARLLDAWGDQLRDEAPPAAAG